MELEYEQNGDYLIPCLKPATQPDEPLTKYGLLRERFLKEHHDMTYTVYLLKGTLKQHLLDVQHQAQDRVELIMNQLKKSEGITEELKRQDQMLWVRKMNNIKAIAESIVYDEIIYSL